MFAESFTRKSLSEFMGRVPRDHVTAPCDKRIHLTDFLSPNRMSKDNLLESSAKILVDGTLCNEVEQGLCRTHQLGTLRHFDHRVPNYNERIFPPWFRPGLCPKPKRVFASWNMVRHYLQMVAIQLRHACALESHVAWSRLFCGNGLPSFRHLAMVVVEDGNVGLKMVLATSSYTAKFWSTTPAVLVSCTSSASAVYVGDAGNTSLVDDGTPWARLRSLPQGVLVVYFGSAASWRPCNVADPHQGPVPHS